jgi:hypothetical protein
MGIIANTISTVRKIKTLYLGWDKEVISKNVLTVFEFLTIGILEIVRCNENKVDEPPDSTTAESYELENSQTNVSHIESVYSEASHKDGK